MDELEMAKIINTFAKEMYGQGHDPEDAWCLTECIELAKMIKAELEGE